LGNDQKISIIQFKAKKISIAHYGHQKLTIKFFWSLI
jgi:hypothetical protein